MQQVSITTEGIQKNLKSFKPLDALCEYIWNGFDAKANAVEVKLHVNQLEMIDMISVIDNGTGIAYEELSDKFKPFNDSKKYDLSKKVNHSLPHGRQGIGRLTFFAFSQLARWSTVYEKDGRHYEYFIEMNKDELNQYNDNNENPPAETNENCGTQVVFTQIQSFSKEDIIERIRSEFFWFLELNRDNGYKITVDGMPILHEDYVISRKILEQPEEVTNNFEITFVQWNHSLGKEFSKFYYIASDGEERYKEATKLNKKSDEFYHSIYIKSSYFNDFYFEKEMEGQTSLFPNKNEDEYKLLMEAINNYLLKYRRDYLKDASNKFIDKLIDSKIYPEFKEDSCLDTYRKEQLDDLVGTLYAAQPKIFTGLSDDNKKITIQLLKLIMDSEDKNNLFTVLKQVVDLDEEEVAELADVLQYTSLTNISKLVRLIEDRQIVIKDLKEIVFNKAFNAYEVEHVQAVVERHYWLFGEQYNLITAAEPDFTLALKGLILSASGKMEDVYIDHEDKNKEMDVFMIRQDRKGDITENVVVELKRPSVSLGDKQLEQVKKYLGVIRSDDRFNMGNVKWTFYLVGNKFNSNGYIERELESNLTHGEQHLVYSIDKGLTKIYVLKWSEIFDEFSKRHEYLLEKLKLEESLWLKKHDSADEAVEDALDTTAVMEKELIPKRAK